MTLLFFALPLPPQLLFLISLPLHNIAADISSFCLLYTSSFATLRFHKCALLYTKFYRICIFMSIYRLVMFYYNLIVHVIIQMCIRDRVCPFQWIPKMSCVHFCGEPNQGMSKIKDITCLLYTSRCV